MKIGLEDSSEGFLYLVYSKGGRVSMLLENTFAAFRNGGRSKNLGGLYQHALCSHSVAMLCCVEKKVVFLYSTSIIYNVVEFLKSDIGNNIYLFLQWGDTMRI